MDLGAGDGMRLDGGTGAEHTPCTTFVCSSVCIATSRLHGQVHFSRAHVHANPFPHTAPSHGDRMCLGLGAGHGQDMGRTVYPEGIARLAFAY